MTWAGVCGAVVVCKSNWEREKKCSGPPFLLLSVLLPPSNSGRGVEGNENFAETPADQAYVVTAKDVRSPWSSLVLDMATWPALFHCL